MDRRPQAGHGLGYRRVKIAKDTDVKIRMMFRRTGRRNRWSTCAASSRTIRKPVTWSTTRSWGLEPRSLPPTRAEVCYGLEIDPAYVDVIVRRWQNFTGGSATLSGTPSTFSEIEIERKQISNGRVGTTTEADGPAGTRG